MSDTPHRVIDLTAPKTPDEIIDEQIAQGKTSGDFVALGITKEDPPPLVITPAPVEINDAHDPKNYITSLNEASMTDTPADTTVVTDVAPPTPVDPAPAVTPVPRWIAAWEDEGYTREVSNAEYFPGTAHFEVFDIEIKDTHDVWYLATSAVTYRIWRLNELNTVSANKYISDLAAKKEGEVITVVGHDVKHADFAIPSDIVAFLGALNAKV